MRKMINGCSGIGIFTSSQTFLQFFSIVYVAALSIVKRLPFGLTAKIFTLCGTFFMNGNDTSASLTPDITEKEAT